jgi:hypothetical protein
MFCPVNLCIAQNPEKRGQKIRKDGNRNNRPPGIFHTEVPARVFDIVLSRPTDHSVNVSIFASEKLTGNILYGLDRA